MVCFWFRGRQEHASLILGDLKLKTDANGHEFVEFYGNNSSILSYIILFKRNIVSLSSLLTALNNFYTLLHIIFSERNTKTRIGAESKNNRPVTPKMFSNDNDYCPVKILKTYISHRPVDIHDDPNARFYLRPLPKPEVRGVMMKEMAGQAELMGRKVNHSTRKTFACTLLQADRPNTEVAQLWFWKNVATLSYPL